MTGTVLSGKYRLLEKLGQGGMGSVWRADHLTLRSQVAIKLIDPIMAANGDALARFHREARAAAALRSPHVVQILDHGVSDGLPYIVMELLEGESLAKSLDRLKRLPASDAARVMTHIARAISRAHEAGIVHRDLKPDNVFLVKNDDEIVAKVLDFGVAKGDGGSGAPTGVATRTGAVLGTPYYMSPEQATGERDVDGRTDLWAMGVIAFECLVGQKPFEGSSMPGLLMAICTQPLPVPSRLGPVPAGFDQWFARCCARDPKARFGSAKEAASELNMLCLAPAPSFPLPSLQATVPMSTLPMLTDAPRLASTVDEMSQVATINHAARTRKGRNSWLWLGGVAAVGVGVFLNRVRVGPDKEPPAASAVPVSSVSPVAAAGVASPAPSAAASAPPPEAPATAPTQPSTPLRGPSPPTPGVIRKDTRPIASNNAPAKVQTTSPSEPAQPTPPAAVPARPNMGF